MARFIVPAGPLGFERPSVAPVQSRVIALELNLQAGAGFIVGCHTPTLGNRTWLRSVDVWAYECVHGVPIGGYFYLMFGSGIPVSPLDISDRWSPIIPLHCGRLRAFRWFECNSFHRRFEMNRLFEDDELRFGVTIVNQFNQDWEATVAFEFSEG